MSVDWSKAPEGATHWDGAELGFMRPSLTVGDWDYFAVGDKWTLYGRINNQICSDMVARPVTWNGEGLPPIGVICEFRTGPGMSWSKGQVLAFSGKKVFYQDYGSHEWSSLYDEIEFRPIRTPEQITADERDQGIEGIRKSVAASENCKAHGIAWDVASAIYDAGYRKQVAP